jgi:EKC/KEOPS complex subunit CGI121/TPRKB
VYQYLDCSKYLFIQIEQITEAIRRYGVSVGTSDLLLVRVDSPQLSATDVEGKMRQVVKGDWVSLSELENITDWSTIKKVFFHISDKLNSNQINPRK